jgi:hypothetical protein
MPESPTRGPGVFDYLDLPFVRALNAAAVRVDAAVPRMAPLSERLLPRSNG